MARRWVSFINLTNQEDINDEKLKPFIAITFQSNKEELLEYAGYELNK